MDGVQLYQGYGDTTERQVPGVPSTCLINFGRMKDTADLGASKWS